MMHEDFGAPEHGVLFRQLETGYRIVSEILKYQEADP
jgi:hypothetical protein